ncbi:PREDICTED: uncharacterized protein LOC108356574 [Rhagoletis zephyria]|uniref:uncharacterized protein LOC108356574 n=1 Tax=Rhagoletis zephyria TaxID=28612 RepID=UPI00081160C5|nr:PREDICTED: uncharacterized protein LOC108356574 [Rhagoletis zephyria]
MSLKRVQNASKCYCNSVASTCCNSHVNCFKRKATGSGSVFSVATKSKQDKQNFNKRTAMGSKSKTDFVKIKRKSAGSIETDKNRRGLGHSQSRAVAATNFSRRNSAATTVTFSTPCATSARTHSSNAITPTPTTSLTSSLSASPTTILKATPVTMAALGDNFRALSVAAKSESDNRGGDLGGALQHEYTERRRYYESAKQLMKLIAARSDNFSTLTIASNGASSDCHDNCAADASLDAERLRALQKFRLQNADECFSVHRQLDLQLPSQRKELARKADEQHTRNLWCALLERENVARSEDGRLKKSDSSKAVPKTVVKESVGAQAPERAKRLQSTSLTPYVVRQKLLQLRLEAEEIGRLKPGRKLYRTEEESCSLRYQATY